VMLESSASSLCNNVNPAKLFTQLKKFSAPPQRGAAANCLAWRRSKRSHDSVQAKVIALSFAFREPYEIRSIEIAPENASMPVTLTVNGQKRLAAVDDDTPLLWVLRDELELTGTKYGCGIAQCGACTVYLDGAPTRSCVTPVSAIEGFGHRGIKRSPRSKGFPGRPPRLSRRPGTQRTFPNAAIASRVRSCRPPRCLQKTTSRPIKTSTPR
jgi:ferredoxin